MFITTIFKHHLDTQLYSLITNNIQKVDLTPEMQALLKYLPIESLKKLYVDENSVVSNNNSWLFTVIILINVTLISVFVGATLLIYKSCGQSLPIKSLLIENAIIFAMIGAVQYWFFTNYALKYVPIIPSHMMTSILANFKKQL
jgi:hypothetical protein